MKDAWKNLLTLVNEVVIHAVGASAILLTLYALRLLIGGIPGLASLAWFEGTPYVFTLGQIFDYADLATIVTFLAIGFIKIVRGMLR